MFSEDLVKGLSCVCHTFYPTSHFPSIRQRSVLSQSLVPDTPDHVLPV